MANHKSAEKRARQSTRRAAVNTQRKSRVKTAEKKVMKAISSKDAKSALAALSEFSRYADRAAKNGVVSKSHANRRKSRLASQVSSLSK